MEKIVYILGAGFSRPLGLPIMSDFLEKSKDQYFAHPEKFAHFKNIFENELKQIHIASDHYQTNVFNIEDILSILEFRARLDPSSADKNEQMNEFIRYLKDVIEFYTPTDTIESNSNALFCDGKWNEYIRFVSALMNCTFQDTHTGLVAGFENQSHIFADFEQKDYQYSVITFNYDRILESVQEHLTTFGSTRYFHRLADLDDPRNQTCFAKLHGSVDGEIILPTWNKGLNPSILPDWKVAYRVLSEANQIRILGYSLPITDTYFRYLLRATIIDTPNLRWIDVICKDNSGSVKKSYGDFVLYHKYRYMEATIEDYLVQNQVYENREGQVYFSLENAHEAFVRKVFA